MPPKLIQPDQFRQLNDIEVDVKEDPPTAGEIENVLKALITTKLVVRQVEN